MQLTKTLFTLFLASSALAAPIKGDVDVTARDEFSMLEARATIDDVTCKGVEANDEKHWTAKEIKSSYNAGKGNVDSKTGKIKDGAPSHLKVFKGNAQILADLPSDCKNIATKDGNLFEYKLKGSDTDRVIWKWTKASASQAYCMTITHRGKSNNDFKACK
ncbi:uncharacterized protein PG986_005205 [Apiospora aurea]|uniref:Uncharacterized protein n=1 Tax=Apiospora aurea TaxID=335848 RepID=A0ABR1QGV9_9PEZI